jgi:hypothetical protein
MQRLGKNITEAMNKHETIPKLLDTSFSMRSMLYQEKQAILSSQNVLLLNCVPVVPVQFRYLPSSGFGATW